MKLYEYADSFSQLFDEFDAIADFEPAQNDAGQYIDDDGNIIPDLAAYKADMQQAWFDTLDGIEEGFETKAENIAAFIKNCKAESDALKKEEDALKARKRVKDNQIKRMKDYLLGCMLQIGRTKIDTPMAKLSVRKNAESADIADEAAFIDMCMKTGLDQYLRFRQPEIDKTAVKKALQSDVHIEGASLSRSTSLVIK